MGGGGQNILSPPPYIFEWGGGRYSPPPVPTPLAISHTIVYGVRYTIPIGCFYLIYVIYRALAYTLV